MLKIALEQSPLFRARHIKEHRTGVYRYVRDLIDGLMLCPDIELHFSHRLDPPLTNYDIFHLLTHSLAAPTFYHQNSKTKVVITVHDLIIWLFPEWLATMSYKHPLVMKSIKKCWAIVPSEHTKQDLIQYYEFDPHKIFVTPLAVCPQTFHKALDANILNKYKIPNAPYFFFLGRLEDRKRIDLLLRAFKKLILQEKLSDINLVLAGPLFCGGNCVNSHYTYHKEILSQGLGDRVILVQLPEKQDLKYLYSHATALTFLSEYEGFGFPPLEAMHCQTPVVCFNNSSLPEVVGEAAIHPSDNHIDTVSSTLLQVLNNPTLCQEKVQMGIEQAKKFNHEKTFALTLQAYRTIANA